MTIMEALHLIDAIKPNTYSSAEKIKWLSTLDGTIKREIIDNNQSAATIVFYGYTENSDLKTELLVPAPYDEIYLFLLESKIDYWNGEVGKYNNSTAMFNEAYTTFSKYYNRTHMRIGDNFKYYGKSNADKGQIAIAVVSITIEEEEADD